MSYSDITFGDTNPVKRWLQKQRLATSLKCSAHMDLTPSVICDFGAGNGELCKLLAGRHPKTKIICYEPTPYLLDEARENLEGISRIEFVEDIREIGSQLADVVYCLEVFEHLPQDETREAIRQISNILKDNGVLVVGVPVEVGVPALYKGIFRMVRRFGAFDASIKNVFTSFLGFPPKDRPIREIAPGFRFHFEHTGFDFRDLRTILGESFTGTSITASPIAILGVWLMPEVYFTVRKN